MGAIKLQIIRRIREKNKKQHNSSETHKGKCYKELDAHTHTHFDHIKSEIKETVVFFSFNSGYAFRCDFHRVKFICRWLNDFILDFNFKLCRISLSLAMTQIDQFGVERHGAHICTSMFIIINNNGYFIIEINLCSAQFE